MTPGAHEQVEPYGWCWAADFLDGHPRDPGNDSENWPGDSDAKDFKIVAILPPIGRN